MKNNIFGIRLKGLREEKGLFQEELASKLGYTRTAIGKWEQGTREPSLDGLVAISRYFSVSIDYLLGNEDF